jgi:hypothetical protein
VLPQIAQGDSNKVWMIPSDLTPLAGDEGRLADAAAEHAASFARNA